MKNKNIFCSMNSVHIVYNMLPMDADPMFVIIEKKILFFLV